MNFVPYKNNFKSYKNDGEIKDIHKAYLQLKKVLKGCCDVVIDQRKYTNRYSFGMRGNVYVELINKGDNILCDIFYEGINEYHKEITPEAKLFIEALKEKIQDYYDIKG